MDESRLASMSHTKVQSVPHVWKKVRAGWGLDFGGKSEDNKKEIVFDIAGLLVEMCACDVAEIFTHPRFTPKCWSMGLRP
eukprot:11552908-Prorocentrum_lima.AAC.1